MKSPDGAKEVPVCPRCANTSVKNAYLLSPVEASRFNTKHLAVGKSVFHNREVFACFRCGYYGICPVMPLFQVPSFRKHIGGHLSEGEFIPPDGLPVMKRFYKWYGRFFAFVLVVFLVVVIVLFVRG